MSTYETLSVEVADSVAELTLTRPDVLNRFDDQLHVEMTSALRELRADRAVRAIVWASTGKVFSAGGSFDLMLAAHADVSERQRIVDDGQLLMRALLDVPQPVVVAMAGDSFGVGTSLALACDAVVTAPGVRIGDPHVNIGLVAGDGGCIVWPASIGMVRARRHLLTGDPIDAADAYALGLVSDLVADREQVLGEARALAARLAALPPLAVQGTKRTLNAVTRARFDEALDLGFANEMVTLASDDLVEAIDAFKARRTPRFEGH